MANAMPAAEVEISVPIVQALLEEQHPDLARLELRFVNEGWDSAIFRLGDDLAVRLPRREVNAVLLPQELHWLPTLAPKLPLPVNEPIRVGAPGCGYPWAWSVSRWFDGDTWADAPVRDAFEAATVLGMFVGALGHPAPPDAPKTPYRGGPLSDRDEALRARVDQLGGSVDRGAVLALWDEALAAPPAADERWVHGDLHPANIIVRDGLVSAVIDWVDLCSGDTAYDLAAAWFCFDDPAARALFQSSTGVVDEATWLRARACALSHALACLANSADNARMHEVGERTLTAVFAP